MQRQADQVLHEFDERRVFERALEDHEAQLPAIGDGRNHVGN